MLPAASCLVSPVVAPYTQASKRRCLQIDMAVEGVGDSLEREGGSSIKGGLKS